MLKQKHGIAAVGVFPRLAMIAALLWSGSVAVAAPETRFTVVDSSSSSWVARGYKNYTVTPADGWTFAPSRNYDNGVGFWIEGPALPGTSVDYWRINFAAPHDALIVPGSYPNFQRWPFQDADRPGLEFASSGRLDNAASGFFEVFEATYGPSGEVLSFSADFTHYGETNPDDYAIVEIRYNVPEPGAAVLAVSGLLLSLRRRRCSAHRRSQRRPSLQCVLGTESRC